MPFDLREHRLTTIYAVATMFATVLWWAGLSLTDWMAPLTLGKAFLPFGLLLLILGDAFSAFLLTLGILVALQKKSHLLPALLWIHFGGQGYAFCVSVIGAILDPKASPGMTFMFFSAGAALMFALRATQLPILWGPFRFQDARGESVNQLARRTLVQSAVMWLVFFAAIPVALSVVESAFGWRQLPIEGSVKVAAGLVFILAGSIGIWSGIEMAKRGEGTPLPSAGTRKLVVTGPYRYIRNPMAFLAVIQGICVGVMLSSPLVIAYSVLGGLAWELLVRPLEEAYLTQKFGSEYLSYQQRVRCWIPALKPKSP